MLLSIPDDFSDPFDMMCFILPRYKSKSRGVIVKSNTVPEKLGTDFD